MSLSSASAFLTQISRIQLGFQSSGAMFPPVSSHQLHCAQSRIPLPLSWISLHVGASSHPKDWVVLAHQMSQYFLCSGGIWTFEPLGGTEFSLEAPWHVKAVVRKPWESANHLSQVTLFLLPPSHSYSATVECFGSQCNGDAWAESIAFRVICQSGAAPSSSRERCVGNALYSQVKARESILSREGREGVVRVSHPGEVETQLAR